MEPAFDCRFTRHLSNILPRVSKGRVAIPFSAHVPHLGKVDTHSAHNRSSHAFYFKGIHFLTSHIMLIHIFESKIRNLLLSCTQITLYCICYSEGARVIKKRYALRLHVGCLSTWRLYFILFTRCCYSGPSIFHWTKNHWSLYLHTSVTSTSKNMRNKSDVFEKTQ